MTCWKEKNSNIGSQQQLHFRKIERDSSAHSLNLANTVNDHFSHFVVLKTNCSGIGAYRVEVHTAFPLWQRNVLNVKIPSFTKKKELMIGCDFFFPFEDLSCSLF